MNGTRRKQIAEQAEAVRNSLEIIETINEDEQAYLDNIPENMQGGEKHAQSDLALQSLADVINSLTEAVEQLEGIE